jgi:hypothetical protein
LWAELDRSVPLPMNCRAVGRQSLQRQTLQHPSRPEPLIITGQSTTECT